jgi:hypothetical protein
MAVAFPSCAIKEPGLRYFLPDGDVLTEHRVDLAGGRGGAGGGGEAGGMTQRSYTSHEYPAA